MKLVEISKHINDYINLDFLTRVWKKDNKCYCELLNKITYQISDDTYNKIMKYVEKTS